MANWKELLGFGRKNTTSDVIAHNVAASDRPATPSIQKATNRDYAFISYSHKDTGIVSQLASYLAHEELPPWIDNQLTYGDSWQNIIVDRIRGCKVFLAVMSPGSSESEFVNREIDLAMAERKIIIPILAGGKPFERLADFQYVEILKADWPETRFVERLRDLIVPTQIPSDDLRRRRAEHLSLALFETSFGPFPVGVTLGIGFDRVFQVSLAQPLAELDELDWAEIFIMLRDKGLIRDLGYKLGIDYAAMFPTIKDFADYLYETLTWEELRRL
jgi:hypothetical protein